MYDPAINQSSVDALPAPSNRISISPKLRGRIFIAARIGCGVLLIVAAVLKGHQLATSPTIEDGLLTFRWFLISVVECELAFGLWLLAGHNANATRRLAFAIFGAFAAVSLYRIAMNEGTCGCFGHVAVSPWLTLLFDLTAVAVFWLGRPQIPATAGIDRPEHPAHVLLGWKRPAGVFLTWMALGVPSGWAMATFEPTKVTAESGLIGDGAIVVLEPSTWVGHAFPLSNYIDLGNELSDGSWTVVLYHHDCPKCQSLIEKFESGAVASPNVYGSHRVALVEMPPFGPGVPKRDGANPILSYGRMAPDREWFVVAPVSIHLKDGKVVGTSQGDG